MAENLGDGEFWLPSEFLVEDILMGNKNRGKENEISVASSPEFQSGFGSFGSGFSSPAGSAETESDEEDYLVLDRLTRQMGRHKLQHRERNPSSFDGEKTKMVMAGSPQSTLCAVGSWAEHSQGSSRNSPTGPSQVSSPPSTSLNPKGDAWDLLNEAAGQIVRMKITGEAPKAQARGLLDPPKKPASSRYYMNQALTLQQLKTNKFQQLKQQQLMKQQSSSFRGKQSMASPSAQQMQQNRSRPVGGGGGGFVKGRCNQGFPPPAAWPPLQQQPQLGSGMRAVFLGESGSRRESCGTGVFLPRRVGTPTELRKKPAACSTVLLPAKVVHALNLKLDEMGAAQPRFHPTTFTHQYDRLASPYNTCIPQQQQRSSHDQGHRPHPAPANQELRLPPEWTY